MGYLVLIETLIIIIQFIAIGIIYLDVEKIKAEFEHEKRNLACFSSIVKELQQD